MGKNIKTARLAGLLWLLMCIFGMFAGITRDKLLVNGDMEVTAHNIMANEFLFRTVIVSDIIMMVVFVLLPLALYKLLNTVDKNLSILMVIFVLVSVPINMINLLNEFSSLHLLSGAQYLNVFEASQLKAQAMLFLDLYEQGYVIAQVFFVIWVLPLGVLVYKSGFLPRIFGIFFAIETCVGLLSSTINFLSPNAVLEANLMIPAGIAEISFMLWLLIRGINESKVKEAYISDAIA